MKAIQLERPEHFMVIDVPEPPSPGPGEARVKVHRVGICGTDLSGYLGKMPFYSYPRIPGHELGVEVVAVGPDVHGIQAGDRCSVEPYINCEKCDACLRGHSNCCENLQVLGVHTDGGLRPGFIVPARKLHPSTNLTFEQLALVETLAIGCHAVNRGASQAGEAVLVIGAGPIGLSVIEFVKLSGARTVVLDLNERRLDFCKRVMGVDAVVVSKGDGSEAEQMKKIVPGGLFRVVIDATGNHQSMSRALHYAAFAGHVVFVGITTGEISFGHPLMHRRELTLFASRNALPADFRRIIELIETARLDTAPWITHRPQFGELIEVFPSYTRPESGVIKAIVQVQ